MNYDKLLDALLEKGIDVDRASEIADWWFAPPGTPYPVPVRVMYNSANWDESKHQRAKDGKFTSGGGGGSPYQKDDEWQRIGRQPNSSVHSPRLDKLRRRIRDQKEEERLMRLSGLQSPPEIAFKEAQIAEARKRHEAELIRQAKHAQRVRREREIDSSDASHMDKAQRVAQLESELEEAYHWSVRARSPKQRARWKKEIGLIEAELDKIEAQSPTPSAKSKKEMEQEYDDLENQIEGLEERYMDRNGGSPSKLKFPSPEAEQEYEELRSRLVSLEKQLYRKR